jgi:UPF0755 protein
MVNRSVDGRRRRLRSGRDRDIKGVDAGAVVERLRQLAIVRRPALFIRYLTYRGLDTGIEAGRYEVSGAMSIVELSELLQRARTSRYTLTVPEGWRMEQVAEALARLDLGFSAGEFLQAVDQSPPDWSDPGFGREPEGSSSRHLSTGPGHVPVEISEMMVADLGKRHTLSGRPGRLGAQALTPFKPSLWRPLSSERRSSPRATADASVFANRLELGIPLQADPTVQYPIGSQAGDWWKAALSAEDLQVESPYNTYLHGGLPPGPIASPGMASLQSVACLPKRYLFFRATCDGSGRHVFAATFKEHVANACP